MNGRAAERSATDTGRGSHSQESPGGFSPEIVAIEWVRDWTTIARIVLAGLLSTWLIACASTSTTPDPYQALNRKVQCFNDGADKYLLKPVAIGYRKVTPDRAERGVGNFFGNLDEPYVALNQLLQGKPRLFFADLARLVVNSTLGVGGLIDVGTRMNLAKHDEDLGQTFGVWGVPTGPYLVLPLLGPSDPRDAVGAIGGFFAFPPRYLDSGAARYGLQGLSLVSGRAELIDNEKLIRGDRYLFVRDAYTQRRDYLVKDGVVDDPFLDDE